MKYFNEVEMKYLQLRLFRLGSLGHILNWGLAIFAGILLASMIEFNSCVALHSTSLFSVFIAHLVGSLTAYLLVVIFQKNIDAYIQTNNQQSVYSLVPKWAYLGGLPGAMAVLIASITVNSTLGLAGSLALMLLGQVCFGFATDWFGLLNNQKKPINLRDIFAACWIMLGSAFIIFL